jgi:N-acetylglutamate synthase-like GNAT family acetyltransferase
MNPAQSCVRRATIDDLKSLVALWEGMNYSAVELEKRLTEFQIVEAADGSIAGAVALEMNNGQGRIHSEAFFDFTFADGHREQLWLRLQVVATNHGLTRLWTHEGAPYWRHSGFVPPHEEDLAKLPDEWHSLPAGWHTLRLKAEEAFVPAVEKQFEQFKEQERERTERALRRAHLLQQWAAAIGIILALCIIAACAYLWSHRNHLPPAP